MSFGSVARLSTSKLQYFQARSSGCPSVQGCALRLRFYQSEKQQPRAEHGTDQVSRAHGLEESTNERVERTRSDASGVETKRFHDLYEPARIPRVFLNLSRIRKSNNINLFCGVLCTSGPFSFLPRRRPPPVPRAFAPWPLQY